MVVTQGQAPSPPSPLPLSLRFSSICMCVNKFSTPSAIYVTVRVNYYENVLEILLVRQEKNKAKWDNRRDPGVKGAYEPGLECSPLALPERYACWHVPPACAPWDPGLWRLKL